MGRTVQLEDGDILARVGSADLDDLRRLSPLGLVDARRRDADLGAHRRAHLAHLEVADVPVLEGLGQGVEIGRAVGNA